MPTPLRNSVARIVRTAVQSRVSGPTNMTHVLVYVHSTVSTLSPRTQLSAIPPQIDHCIMKVAHYLITVAVVVLASSVSVLAAPTIDPGCGFQHKLC